MGIGPNPQYEKLREKVLYVSSYTSDSKFKGYISTLNEKSKTEYDTDSNNNAKKNYKCESV